MKIIIDNRTEIPMQDVLVMVSKVIADGRVSDGGKSYCSVTTFSIKGSSDPMTGIYSKRNKSSDTFIAFKVDSND